MKEILEKHLADYHAEISKLYGPLGLSFQKLYTGKCKTIASYFFSRKEIVYDLEQVAFNGVRSVVLHEFAHHIQYSRFGYTRHDFLFCLINQMLNCKHIAQGAFNIRIYDIHEDKFLNKEKLNIFFVASEVNRLAKLPFEEAINGCKALQISVLGEQELEDFDYSDETEIIKIREKLYGTNITTT